MKVFITMNDAEVSFSVAEELISFATREDATFLDFNQPEFRNLETLPASISKLQSLEVIDLSNTRLKDVSPLADLRDLRELSLDGTEVNNLIPLMNSKNIRRISAARTNVSSITPLKNLDTFVALDLADTQVADLSPLLSVDRVLDLNISKTSVIDMRPILTVMSHDGPPYAKLAFTEAKACTLDPSLAECAAIEDPKLRLWHTLNYVESLPPYPEKLPFANEGSEASQQSEHLKRPMPEAAVAISLSDAKQILDDRFPELRDRCEAVFSLVDDALVYHNTRIPNEPDALNEHRYIEQSLSFSRALISGIHDAIPHKDSRQVISEEEVNRLKEAFQHAVATLQDASAYIDQTHHTPTFGGLLKLGCAQAVGSVMALLPGVSASAAVPAIYSCLYGQDSAGSVVSMFTR